MQTPWITQQNGVYEKELPQSMLLTQQNFQQAKVSNPPSPKYVGNNPKSRQIKLPVNKLTG